jgi:hypothetical protein
MPNTRTVEAEPEPIVIALDRTAVIIGSYFPDFHEGRRKMIKAQGGIFGWVTTSERLLSALD